MMTWTNFPRTKQLLNFCVLVASTGVLQCLATSRADFIKGKLFLKGDSAWVRVDFPNQLTSPVVFLGLPDYIGNSRLLPQVGTVDKDGFTARVMIPSCITADMRNTRIVVPYVALPTTTASDYFAHRFLMRKAMGVSVFDASTKTYTNNAWTPLSPDYVVLIQIQNMAAIEDQATEFVTTPYVFATAHAEPLTKKVHFSISAPITSEVDAVVMAVMALKSTASPALGGTQIELNAESYLIPGQGLPHGLASHIIAFLHPRDTKDAYSFPIQDSDSLRRVVPRTPTDCHSSAPAGELSASFLLVGNEATSSSAFNPFPDCELASSKLYPEEVCRTVCKMIWSNYKEFILRCTDRTKCFKDFFSQAYSVKSSLRLSVDPRVVEELSQSCSFESISPDDNPEKNEPKFQKSECRAVRAERNVFSATGSCACPSGQALCNLEESISDGTWNKAQYFRHPVLVARSLVLDPTNKRLTQLSSSDRTCSTPNLYALCKRVQNMRDRGPQCTELSSSVATTLKGMVCKDLCLESWELFRSQSMNSPSPYATFMELYNDWVAENPLLLPASLIAIARTCTFGKRPHFAPAPQFERQGIFVREESQYVLRDGCPDTYKMTIVGAVFGCKEVILDGDYKPSCEIKDVTTIAVDACASLRSGSEACSIVQGSLPSTVDVCPSCKTFSLLLYYSCRITSESMKGHEISIQRPSGSIVHSGNIPSCGCTDESEPAKAEEAIALKDWQESLTLPAKFFLGGARILSYNHNGKLTISSWIPSTEEECQDSSFQVLCKHSSLVGPNEGMMSPTPVCDQAFSTKNTKDSFQDVLCKETCKNILQGVCANETNQWACAHKYMRNCYIPNSLGKTCGLLSPSEEYNPKFKTCGCANDPAIEPCTEAEIKYLAFDWTHNFEQNFQGIGGLILMRNMRVMDNAGATYIDSRVKDSSVCTNTSRYKGIFCRVNASAITPSREDLKPNCADAKSDSLDIVSHYQCAYSCFMAYTSCKEQGSFNSTCFSQARKDHEHLRHCTVPFVLEDIVKGESNMLTGTVRITTDWRKVTFPSKVSPNPVVFTGLLSPLKTFAQAQVTEVSETGFRIRLALDYCRSGFAAAYVDVSWLAISEGRYAVSESGDRIRVATAVGIVGEESNIKPGIELVSSYPVLLTQVQNIPPELSMEDIPFISLSQVGKTSAKITVQSTSADPARKSFIIGFLYMDEVEPGHCSTPCRTNNLVLETKSIAFVPGTPPVMEYSAVFNGRAPFIFGSIMLPQRDEIKRMLVTLDSATPKWKPNVFVVSNDTCNNFVFEEAPAGTSELRIVTLFVEAQNSQIEEESFTGFIPNCKEAKSKEGGTIKDCVTECKAIFDKCPLPKTWDCFLTAASKTFKDSCYVESYNESSITTTSTLKPINKEGQCRVVDMNEIDEGEYVGWDVNAMSCSCPQGFSPCTPQQVEQDRVHWINDVAAWGTICRMWDNVKPVAAGFMQVVNDICTFNVNLEWRQRPMPLYSFDDVFVNKKILKSAYTQCAHETNFVFCPAASLTTTTTTTAPIWNWPENADCLPGYWSEWSACSATCTPSDDNQQVPVRKRRRPQLMPARGNGAPCSLEEAEPCVFDTPMPCNSLCLHSEWSSWSACSEQLLVFGVSRVKTSTREKHVLAESGEACAALNLKEYNSSRCTNGGSTLPSPPTVPSALQISNEANADSGAEKWSEWSSCDSPCVLNGKQSRRYKLSLKQGAKEGELPVYEKTQSDACPDSLEPCKNDREPSCKDISPQHDIPQYREFCQEKCEHILKTCAVEAGLRETTRLQCLAEEFTQNPTLSGQCLLSPELIKEAKAPTCFPSYARANDDASSVHRFLDPDSSTPQCLCLEPNSVPCTAAEVFHSREFSFTSLSNIVCPSQEIGGAMFDADTPGSADSKFYFAAADLGKIFCPLSSSKNQKQQASAATYSKFANADELNNYCANGLPFQQELSATNADMDCDLVISRTSSMSAEDCKKKCRQIKENCYEIPKNFLSCTAAQRQETQFDKECATKRTLSAGRGIVFCKLVPRDCRYSEWGSWSSCSSTCRNGPAGMTDSVRIRKRHILEQSSYGGQPCRSGSAKTGDGKADAGTVESQVCFFQELCDDLEPAVLLPITPKPEPSLESYSLVSSSSTTTTTTKPPHQTICTIVDMTDYYMEPAYDSKYRTCKCPEYTRPCMFAEVEGSRSSWNEAMMALCQKNSMATIPLENFKVLSCDTRTFKDPSYFNEFTAEEHCSTAQYANVFCVEAADEEAERRQVLITFIVMLIGGTIFGIILVLWFIQHSVDVQNVLGLRGRYVELANMVKE